MIRLLSPYSYDKIYTICDGVRVRFTDIGTPGIGHVSSGSPRAHGKRSSFQETQETGAPAQGSALTEEADYVVMESTYGDRLHDKMWAIPSRSWHRS